MKSSDVSPEFEQLVRERLHAFADNAPTAVYESSAIHLEPVSDRNRPPRRRIAGIGALVIALGGGFALTTVAVTGGDTGGESTPEGAVVAFIDAIEDRDVLGALDVLDPGESAALIDVARRAVGEATRVGLLSDAADLSDVAGSSAAVDGLVLTTETVASDLAVVHLTGGTLDLQFDLATLPFSEQLRDRLPDEAPAPTPPTDLSQTNWQLATVLRDGNWYVSIGFTLAELARQASDQEPPLEAGVDPEGFESPEEAAAAFWQRLAAFDLQDAARTAAPGETDAILRYSPLWLSWTADVIGGAQAEGLTVAVAGLAFEVTGDGDQRRLTPSAYVIEGTFPASEYDVSFDTFDPDLATLITRLDDDGAGRVLVIPPGEPIPTDDELGALAPEEFTEELTVELEAGAPFNAALILPDGSLQRLWSEPDNRGDDTDPSAPETFRYELADGCTTVSGTALAGDSLFAASAGTNALEQISDGVWRKCGEDSLVQTLSIPSILLGSVGFAAPRLPPIEVIEVDGEWYVSPIRSAVASILAGVEQVPDGEVFFLDGPLAPLLYSTDLAGLEAILINRTLDELPPTCADFVITDGSDVVTAVERTGPFASVRECFFGTFDDIATLGFPSTVDASVPAPAND